VTKRSLAFTLIAFVMQASVACADATMSEDKVSTLDTQDMVSLGTLGPSFYWVALQTQDGQPKDQKLLDRNGKTLAKVSTAFMKQMKLEGTGKLLDGRIINYDRKVTRPDGTSEIRWRLCGPEAPYGYGIENRILKPFRSVAIDPTVVPMDSKLFIPAAKGIKLPDGTIHDGMFEAVDIGSAIIDRRIDIFTSYGDQSAVFQQHGLKHGQQTEVFLVRNRAR